MAFHTERLYIFSHDARHGDQLIKVLTRGDSKDANIFYDAFAEIEVNQAPTLEFSVPVLELEEGEEDIKEGDYAFFVDETGRQYAFWIGEESDRHNRDGKQRTFICDHICVKELNDEYVKSIVNNLPNYDLRMENYTFPQMANRIFQNSRWKVGYVDPSIGSTEKTLYLYFKKTAEALVELVKLFDVEVSFRIEHNGHQIVNRYVDFYKRMGEDNGVRFEFGTDIVEIERKVDATNVKTLMIGRGKGEESGDGYGRRITFEDVEWSVANGDPVDKPLGLPYVTIQNENLYRWGIYQNGEITHREDEVIFEEEEDKVRLLERTYEHLLNVSTPRVTYDAKVIYLAAINPELRHKATGLGDVVRIVDRDFPWKEYLTTRVIRKLVPIGRPEETQVRFGDTVPDIANIVRRVNDRSRNSLRVGDPIDWLEGALNLATKRIIGANTFLYIGESQTYPGIFLPNKPENNNPTAGILLTANGILLADRTKEDGTLDFRVAITGSGIIADFITAGTLDASQIVIRSAADDNEIFVTAGAIQGYYQNNLAYELQRYWLQFYDYGINPADLGKKLGAVGTLIGRVSYGDTDVDVDRTGVGIWTNSDFVTLGWQGGDASPDSNHVGYFIQGSHYPNKLLMIYSYPTINSDQYTEIRMFADSRAEMIEGISHQTAGIKILSGKVASTGRRLGSVYVYVDEFEGTTTGQARFSVWRNIGRDTREEIFYVTAEGIVGMDANDIFFGIRSDNTYRGQLHTDDDYLWIMFNNSNYIKMNQNQFDFYFSGTLRHSFRANGTKSGGSIELENAEVWGMSPVDSPRVLIEDVLFDIDIDTDENKIIYLDERFAEAVNYRFSVFPNSAKVEVIKKGDDYFVVKSEENVTVDFRVIGIRKGEEETYFVDMKNPKQKNEMKMMALNENEEVSNMGNVPKDGGGEDSWDNQRTSLLMS